MDDKKEGQDMPEDGIFHQGPEAVNISGAAIGSREGGTPHPRREAGTGQVNHGVQNLGIGSITMTGCITGPNAVLRIGPGPEPETG